jgi:nucleoid-associated protein YgaU
MFAALRRGTRVTALVAVEGASLVLLATVGSGPAFAVPWSRLGEWVQHAPPGDVVVALLRWVALAGVGWVSATTLLYLAAAASRVPAATRALRWSTMPVVRRAVDAAFAVSVVGSAVVAPVAAAARPAGAPTVTVVRDGRRPGVVEPATRPVVAPSSTPPAPSPLEAVLEPGDNLWDLAARTLAAATGRQSLEIADADVARYWVRLCDANRARLRSGDPDLVYPGERVVLPPIA